MESTQTVKHQIELDYKENLRHASNQLLHIVCVASQKFEATKATNASTLGLTTKPCCRICVWQQQNVQRLVHHVGCLTVGDVLCLPLENITGKVFIEIYTTAHVARNLSETRFVNSVVNEFLVAQDGAPSVAKLLHHSDAERTSAPWIPPHAEQLLQTSPQINMFVDGNCDATTARDNSEVCCVARKKAKPKYHRRCPAIQVPIDIRGILRRAALGEAAWKQCGATFSTMMRHFQKAPDVFEWKTDEDKRTVIRHNSKNQQLAHGSRHR